MKAQDSITIQDKFFISIKEKFGSFTRCIFSNEVFKMKTGQML